MIARRERVIRLSRAEEEKGGSERRVDAECVVGSHWFMEKSSHRLENDYAGVIGINYY